jgi:hypothetical protein
MTRQTPVAKTLGYIDSLCSMEQKPVLQHAQLPVQAVAPQVAYRRVQLNRNGLRPADLLALQRTVGNRAVQRMLAKANDEQPGETAEEDAESTVQTKLTAGAPDGVHTQEADRVARQGMTLPEAAAQRPNRTGLPDGLKTGIESLSGLSMEDIKVHFNSSQPAQLNTLAYTQGSDIHVAPGQERHLPHEAWHVVQQAQGRVQPTMQLQDGVPVNDDAGLEQEADTMGERASASAAQLTDAPEKQTLEQGKRARTAPIQRVIYFSVEGGTGSNQCPAKAPFWVSTLADVNNSLHAEAPTAQAAAEGALGVNHDEVAAEVTKSKGENNELGTYRFYTDWGPDSPLLVNPMHDSDPTAILHKVTAKSVETYYPVPHDHAGQWSSADVKANGGAQKITSGGNATYSRFPGAHLHYLHMPAGEAQQSFAHGRTAKEGFTSDWVDTSALKTAKPHK